MGFAANAVRLPVLVALTLFPFGGTAPASAQDGAASVTAKANNVFEPERITIPVGGTVTWTNEGGFHTVTGGSGGTADPSSPMNGTLTSPGATYSVTFDKAGTYPYFCQPHVSVGMVGEVVVGGATPSETPSTPAPTATVRPTAPGPTPTGEAPGETEPGDDHEEGEHGEVPGLADNPKLEEIAQERGAQDGAIDGFLAFTWASVAAIFALGAALFASTRRRPGDR